MRMHRFCKLIQALHMNAHRLQCKYQLIVYSTKITNIRNIYKIQSDLKSNIVFSVVLITLCDKKIASLFIMKAHF